MAARAARVSVSGWRRAAVSWILLRTGSKSRVNAARPSASERTVSGDASLCASFSLDTVQTDEFEVVGQRREADSRILVNAADAPVSVPATADRLTPIVPTLCPGPKGGVVVVIFDLAVECDSLTAFVALRASSWIADDADAVGGEAVNAKLVINPDMKIFNGETVSDAIGLCIAVCDLRSARGSPVLYRIGSRPLRGPRWIDPRLSLVRCPAGNENGPVQPLQGMSERPGLRSHGLLAEVQDVTRRILRHR